MLATGTQGPGRVHALVFSSPSTLPNPDPNDNLFPKLLQLQNGSVWMVWEKVVPAMGGDIYLMANNGYGWGGAAPIVPGSYDDISPSIVQLDNGTVILVWSRGNAGNLNSYNIYCATYTNGKWTGPSAIVTSSPPNFDPVLTKAGNGTVWMVWSRASVTNGGGDLDYKLLSSGIWSPEAVIPTASSPSYEEKLPTVAQTPEGKMMVAYESNQAGSAQLYYTTFTGSSWIAAKALTSTTNTDKWPSITVDRNGSLWIFWARELPNGTSLPPNPASQYQWDIFYKTSSDNGTTWTNDAKLTISLNTNEQHPTVFQGLDKELWIVYDSCCNSPGNPYGNPNLFIIKSNLIPAHDMAVSSIGMLPGPNPRIGESTSFTVTVSNPGDYTESSTLTFYINSTLLGYKTLTLDPGTSQIYTFVWASSGHDAAKYVAIAEVAPVPREVLTQNNRLNSRFLLTFFGDVNRDGVVSIIDVSTIAVHFGTSIRDSGYYEQADLNHDRVINILDLALCTLDFGKRVS